jgi:hypothetical protein
VLSGPMLNRRNCCCPEAWRHARHCDAGLSHQTAYRLPHAIGASPPTGGLPEELGSAKIGTPPRLPRETAPEDGSADRELTLRRLVRESDLFVPSFVVAQVEALFRSRLTCCLSFTTPPAMCR